MPIAIPHAAYEIRRVFTRDALSKSMMFILIFAIVLVVFIFASAELTILANPGMGTTALNSALIPTTTIATSFIFSVSTVLYLRIVEKKRISDMVGFLGLSRDRLSYDTLFTGGMLFAAVFLIEIAVSGIAYFYPNANLSTNIGLLLSGQPLYFLLFTIFIGPVNEEIFFRGLLVQRIGVFWSAVIFAILHTSYMSYTEFAGALLFGLLAGYVFRKNKSLYSTMLPHILINLIAVMSFLQF